MNRFIRNQKLVGKVSVRCPLCNFLNFFAKCEQHGNGAGGVRIAGKSRSCKGSSIQHLGREKLSFCQADIKGGKYAGNDVLKQNEPAQGKGEQFFCKMVYHCADKNAHDAFCKRNLSNCLQQLFIIKIF